MEESTGINRRSSIARLLAVVLLPVFLIVATAVSTSGCSKNGNAQTTSDADQAENDGAENAEEKDGDEKKEENGKAPVPVRVATVNEGSVSAYITATANLVAEEQVKILAEAEGRVSQLTVDEGDYVKKGQVLAALVRDEEEIAVDKARFRESNARLAYERAEDLKQKELISTEEYDRLRTDYDIAKSELAEAEWNLSKTTIRAPFSGAISERMIQLGQHVQMADELFQITDFDPLIARIFLPERDVINLAAGQSVRITLNADPSVRFAARIRQISPIVDTETGTVKLTVEASSPPPSVRPGSFVTVDIVRETRDQVVLVPREAVIRELQKAHVFVATDEDEAAKRSVVLGLEEGKWVQALSGVEVGETVIVAGQGGLKDGSPIKLLEPEEVNVASTREG